MSPGKSYIVGERGPELITAKNHAMVTPMSHGSGSKQPIYQTNNFNGFKETDNFKRSASQMASMLHRQTSLAMARG